MTKRVSVAISEKAGAVTAVASVPDGCRRVLVLSHGAGAGMDHPFMQTLSDLLNEADIGTYRFNFPYTEQGKRAPNAQSILLATVEAVTARVVHEYPNAQVFFGGKSMGGRMGSIAAAKGMLPGIQGLIFFGFPLHAPGRDSVDRAAHLAKIDVPMLFHQGTRDKLANLDMIREVCASIDKYATLKVYEGADHSFKTRKKDPLDTEETMHAMVKATAGWIKTAR
ncbi:MAG: alpha/beta hydrolase [Rhodothermales bacterium]|nr:alpha/beta hydrolase [Rhodothermales bacterium]